MFDEEDEVELVDGVVRVPVKLTAKQWKWLRTLTSDLRSEDISDAVQVCVNSHVEASEKGGLNPSKYQAIKSFENCMSRCDWRDMIPVVERFKLLLQQAEIRDKLQEEK